MTYTELPSFQRKSIVATLLIFLVFVTLFIFNQIKQYLVTPSVPILVEEFDETNRPLTEAEQREIYEAVVAAGTAELSEEEHAEVVESIETRMAEEEPPSDAEMQEIFNSIP